MTRGGTLLKIRGLTVRFNRWGQSLTALDSVDLDVPNGQWLMLVGHNGSGKSTLLKAISSRIAYDSGTIELAGKEVSKMHGSELAKEVFHLHQDPLLGTAPLLTVFENLLVADWETNERTFSRRVVFERYYKMLEPLGLDGRMKQLARNLSGGERQFLALLIARLRPASLVLLDEPLAALDPAKSDICLRMIEALNKSGKTIIQVTHDPMLAATRGNRTVAIHRGKILSDTSGEERDPTTLFPNWKESV